MTNAETPAKIDALIAELNAFVPLPGVPPDDWIELNRLDEIVQDLSGPNGARAIPALFGVWERFPGYEDHGVFWSILHALEALPGYENELIASVRRAPGEWNLRMVNRVLNGGETHVGSVDLMQLLRETAARSDISETARQEAQSYIDYQEAKTKDAASYPGV